MFIFVIIPYSCSRACHINFFFLPGAAAALLANLLALCDARTCLYFLKLRRVTQMAMPKMNTMPSASDTVAMIVGEQPSGPSSCIGKHSLQLPGLGSEHSLQPVVQAEHTFGQSSLLTSSSTSHPSLSKVGSLSNAGIRVAAATFF